MNGTARRWSLLSIVSVASACGGGSSSIELIFPNESAREATKQIVVYAYSRDSVAVQAVDVGCGDLLGQLGRGESLQGNPVDNPFDAPFTEHEITAFPSGDPVIFVAGFDAQTGLKKPIIEGCTEAFDTSGNDKDVPITLRVVIPERIALQKVGGDRQVGHPGQVLPVGVKVRLTGSLPPDFSESYPIPGVSLRFMPDQALTLGDLAAGALATLDTNVEGEAEVTVRMPDRVGTYSIVVNRDDATSAMGPTFSVSAVAPVAFAPASVDVIGTAGSIRTPIAVALGNVVGNPTRDVVILGCDGDNPGCRVGQATKGPAQNTQLVVLEDAVALRGAKATIGFADFGVAPGGLLVGELLPQPAGFDDVAFVNSRRIGNGGRELEGSEIFVLRGGLTRLDREGRHVLTASNAVGLVGYRHEPADAYLSLMTAGQGRRDNSRRCAITPSCLPQVIPGIDCEANPQMCGCPPGEHCLGDGEIGRCLADDRIIDRLTNRYNTAQDRFENFNGCRVRVLTCNKSSPAGNSSCECLDNAANACTVNDNCSCPVPNSVPIGVSRSARFPFGLASGSLRSAGLVDVVAATDNGLDFLEARGPSNWNWLGAPIFTDQTNRVIIGSLDGDRFPDLAFMATRLCPESGQQEDPCPIVGGVPTIPEPAADEVAAAGCFGVMLKDDRLSEFIEGSCRRFALDYIPFDMCSGDFNGDGGLDFVVSSTQTTSIVVYSGDGNGGVLFPPDVIPMPGERRGGPVACGRYDDDASDDIVVVAHDTRDVVVFRSGM